MFTTTQFDRSDQVIVRSITFTSAIQADILSDGLLSKDNYQHAVTALLLTETQGRLTYTSFSAYGLDLPSVTKKLMTEITEYLCDPTSHRAPLLGSSYDGR